MSRDQQITTALFDLDGVVAFTDKYHYLGWKKLCDERGWKFDQNVNHRLRGIARMASLDVILQHNKVSLDNKTKEALADHKNEYYKQMLQQLSTQDLYPGIVEFVQALRKRNVKVGLCSASKNAKFILDRLGITTLFDEVVTGEDIVKAKPDPEIFLTCAKRLGVQPSHCVVFEDAEAGIEAGLSAGMKCIGVGNRDVLPNAPVNITRYEDINIDALLRTC